MLVDFESDVLIHQRPGATMLRASASVQSLKTRFCQSSLPLSYQWARTIAITTTTTNPYGTCLAALVFNPTGVFVHYPRQTTKMSM